MDEMEYKISIRYEAYLEKLARLIQRKWDLLDMMVHEGYEVNLRAILWL